MSLIKSIKKGICRITPQPVLSLYMARRQKLHAEEERLQAMVGPPGLFKESRDFQLEFMLKRGLNPESTLLDIGCGPLRGGILFIDYLNSGKYSGVDIRQEVIQEGLDQISKNDLSSKDANVRTSNTFGLEELEARSYDFIWCFQLFYHLDDDLIDACMKSISALLAPNGACYATVNIEASEGEWLEFPYVKRSLEFYKRLAESHGLEMLNLGAIRNWGFTTAASVGQHNPMLEFRLRQDA